VRPDKGTDTLTTLALAFALPGLTGGPLPVMILLFGVMYFVMIAPQQRKQKRWAEMLGKIKSGDVVITSGGIRGTVYAVREDIIVLRIAPDNIKLEFAKNAIASVITADETK
jgi:preprotein translocase subunit YajC